MIENNKVKELFAGKSENRKCFFKRNERGFFCCLQRNVTAKREEFIVREKGRRNGKVFEIVWIKMGWNKSNRNTE